MMLADWERLAEALRQEGVDLETSEAAAAAWDLLDSDQREAAFRRLGLDPELAAKARAGPDGLQLPDPPMTIAVEGHDNGEPAAVEAEAEFEAAFRAMPGGPGAQLLQVAEQQAAPDGESAATAEPAVLQRPLEPPLPAGTKLEGRYDINPPFCAARIYTHPQLQAPMYEVLEPPLDALEQKVLAFLKETIVDTIDVSYEDLLEGNKPEVLDRIITEIASDYGVTLEPEQDRVLRYYLHRDFLGYGPMDAFLRDPLIEDVSCDGPHQPVFLYHRQFEHVTTNAKFANHDELDRYVIRLAQRSGKHITISSPLLDATLPDGSRLNATLAKEVTSHGSTFTIRKFKPDPYTALDLVRFGTLNPEMVAYQWLALESAHSLLYAGGTASGKTTSLNALLPFVPLRFKVVSIEDTRELNLPHPNWIAGTTRVGFGPSVGGKQAGEIDMFTLLRAALRQRPEAICVGEVRGEEAFILFQAMSTGHAAYGTLHADSAETAIHRLESPPLAVPRSLLSALDVLAIQSQVRIKGHRSRRCKEIVEIVGLDPNTEDLLTNSVFSWDPVNDRFQFSGRSYVLEEIAQAQGSDPRQLVDEMERRARVIAWMVGTEVQTMKDMMDRVTRYRADADAVLEDVKAWEARGSGA